MDTAYIDRRNDAMSTQHDCQNDRDDLVESVDAVIADAKDRTPDYDGPRYGWQNYRGMIKNK